MRRIFMIVLTLCVSKSFAQQWTVFNTVNSGLQDNNVAKILITRNGTKWFSTTGGITKFDGTTWTPFCGIGSEYIGKSIALDTADQLWHYRGGCMSQGVTICNESGNCYTHNDTVIRTFPLRDTSYIPFRPSFFTIDNSNKIWMFDESKNRVFSFDIADSSWNTYAAPISISSFVASKERNNFVWYSNGSSLISFNINTQQYTSHQLNPVGTILDIELNQSSGVWLGTLNSGLFYYDGSVFTNYTTSNSNLPSNNATNVVLDNAGKLWIGTGYGFSIFDGTTWKNFYKNNSGLPDNTVTDIAFDINGKVWIATATEGVVTTLANSVNISEPVNFDALKIYPNPSSGKFVFDFNGLPTHTLSRLTVFDVLGNIVHDEPFDNMQLLTVDIANMSKGFYVFKIMDATGLQLHQGKLIKQE